MDKRTFLKTLGLTVGSGLVGSRAAAAAEMPGHEDTAAVLVDMTRCLGCRQCELSCAEVNGLKEPDLDDESVFDQRRKTASDSYCVVNRYTDEDDNEFFVKQQCMHCLQPACASACLTKAMYKTENGNVIWRGDKCMGCRFCMISCPFDVPKFEYFSANPKISKCTMCWERCKDGKMPACVENCGGDALQFGKRSELLQIARKRIVNDPDTYVQHIYGEHEAGGTGVLYLSSVPFDTLGFRTDLGSTPYPEYTKEFLYGVPVVLTLWPALMLGMYKASNRVKAVQQEEQDDE